MSPREIEARDTRRMVQVMREVGGPSGQALGQGWLVADALGSWADYAVGLGINGPEPQGRVQALVDYYVARGRVPRIQVPDGAHPSWRSALTSGGFEAYDADVVLRCTLGEIQPPQRDPISFRVVNPDAPRDVTLWVQAQAQGFSPHQTPPEGAKAIAARVARSPRSLCLLVFWEGALAASGGLEFYEQSAVLFGGATLPAFRKRGLQSALIQQRLHLAQGRGATYALIGSEPGGPTERNAGRAGFVENHRVWAYKR